MQVLISVNCIEQVECSWRSEQKCTLWGWRTRQAEFGKSRPNLGQAPTVTLTLSVLCGVGEPDKPSWQAESSAFSFFDSWRQLKDDYFMTYEMTWKSHFSIHKVLLEPGNHTQVYTWVVAAFLLPGQSWVVAAVIIWPAKPKIFTITL